MRKFLLSLFAFFISFFSFAQGNNSITIGKIDSIQSTILNEKRKIWVYTPYSELNPNSIFTQQKYPVVYVLDGNAHFYSVVGMIQQLSQVNGNTVVPEMIVVGIPNTNRTRDLTPTKAIDDPFLKNQPAISKSSGGGEAFISFIEKELIPHIDAKYPTQPFKMLVGHSFGGLTVMNAVVNHTRLFNAYVSIDPSMWWDNMAFLQNTKKALAEKDFGATILYVGIANTMDEGMELNKALKDTATNTRQIRSIMDMDRFIKKQKPKGLKYDSKYYDNDTHGSAPLIATYDALRFIFDKSQLKIGQRDLEDSTARVGDKFRHRYKELSRIYGYEVKPGEIEVNTWAYRFMNLKQPRKAEDLFKMNIENYPNSFNVYDSYGDFFVAIGDKAKAIEQFKKALAIRDYDATRQKLNKLSE